MRVLFWIMVGLFSVSCTKKSDVKDEPTPEKSKESQVITELNPHNVNAPNTAAALATFNALFDGKKVGFIEGLAIRAGLSSIVLPVRKVLSTFLEDDTKFDCYDRNGQEMKCKTITERGDFQTRMIFTHGLYLLHFCGIEEGVIAVKKADDKFWSTVNNVAGATEKAAMQAAVYQHASVVSMNGLTLKIEKKAPGGLQVTSFRASLGAVVPGSDEEKEFVAKDCATFHEIDLPPLPENAKKDL